MSIGTRQSFGLRVRALRKQQGFTLRQFALMINIDKNSLVNIEYGRQGTSLDIIEKIASGLDISLEQLFSDVEMRRDPLPGTDPKPTKSYRSIRF